MFLSYDQIQVAILGSVRLLPACLCMVVFAFLSTGHLGQDV